MGDEVAQPASFSAQLGFGPLCAFRLVSYSPSLCVVQLLATLGEGTAQVVHVEFLVDLLAAPFQTGAARRIAHGSLTNTRLGRCAQDDIVSGSPHSGATDPMTCGQHVLRLRANYTV